MSVWRTKPLPLVIVTVGILANLLLSSGVSASVGKAAASWTGPENNFPLNWSSDNQTAINSGNVDRLQVQWTFPVPSAPKGLISSAEGAMVTPLIFEGVVYTVTNWHRVYALNLENGDVVWSVDLPLMANYSRYLQPSVPGPLGTPLGHYHAIFITTQLWDEPLLWMVSNTYQVFALKATTGDIVMDFNPLVSDRQTGIQGSYGLYDVNSPSILIDQRHGVLMFSPSVTEGDSAGRGFVEGWDVNTTTPKFLWRSYLIPPQDGSDPSWSLRSVKNMSHAFIFDGKTALDLKSLPTGELTKMLAGDWGRFGFNGTRSFAGASASWGGAWAIDERSRLAYIGTNVPGPDWNATYRPGPNLWSSSVLALNLTTGRIAWAFQAMPHALGDLDCSWNVILANQTIGGVTMPVVYKGCKSGYVFALDASSGKLIWYLRPPAVRFENVENLDPLNSTQMTKVNWFGYPSTKPIIQNPSDTGALESDLAFDPATNTIFAATYNNPKLFNYTPVGPPKTPENVTAWEFSWGVQILTIHPEGPINTTVYAVDAATGKPGWSYTIQDQPYRGGLTVSGGVVYVSTLDGKMRMLDESTGRLISTIQVGGSLLTQPSIGQDGNGRMEVVLTDMGSTRWGPPFPGFIQALAIPASAGETAGTGQQLLETQLVAVTSVGVTLVLAAAWIRRVGNRS